MNIAIHQPDFLPWLGFFVKMKKSDVLIILDHTENNPRDAAFWGRRVQIAVNNREQWLSIPLEKVHGRIGIPINEMKINLQSGDFIKSHLKTISSAYGKTPFFKEFFPVIEHFFNMPTPYLLERNMFFINWVKEQLEIKTIMVNSSDYSPNGKATDMLIDLIKKVGGTTYISGDGASGYMEMDKFAFNGIHVRFNNFQPPIYEQYNTESFIKGLSVIDVLMNLGSEGTKQLLNSLTKQSDVPTENN